MVDVVNVTYSPEKGPIVNVTVKSAYILHRDGKVVVDLDAHYDLSNVDLEMHEMVLHWIARTIRIGMVGTADLARDAIYRARKEHYATLTWWQRLFAKKPFEFELEDESTHLYPNQETA